MNTMMKSILAITAATVLATGAQAAVSYGASNVGQPYVGVKFGQIDIDGDAPKLNAYGVYGGYNFDQNFGAELEYLSSEDKDFSVGAGRYEASAKTYGAYGTYRYHFNNTPLYVKGKLGVSKSELEVAGTNVNFRSESDKTSLAGGVGVGFQPNQNFAVEAGYNYLNSDANALSIGAHLAF